MRQVPNTQRLPLEMTPEEKALYQDVKEALMASMYGAGQIYIGRIRGEYPPNDYAALEERVLAIFSQEGR